MILGLVVLVLLMILHICSLCKTNATSQQALLLHAEGKKHRAKARAFHAANQQSKQTEESTPNPNISTVSTQKDVKESKEENSTKVALANNSSEAENGILPTNRKRKSDLSENGRARKKVGHDTTVELGNGEVMRIGRAEKEVKDDEVVNSISAKEDSKQKIKWKKFITTALKSVCTSENYHFLQLIYYFRSFPIFWLDMYLYLC